MGKNIIKLHGSMKLHVRLRDELSILLVKIGSTMFTPNNTKIDWGVTEKRIQYFVREKKTKNKILILEPVGEKECDPDKFILLVSDDIRDKLKLNLALESMKYIFKNSKIDYSIWEKLISQKSKEDFIKGGTEIEFKK
jgi:hypothetical protein